MRPWISYLRMSSLLSMYASQHIHLILLQHWFCTLASWLKFSNSWRCFYSQIMVMAIVCTSVNLCLPYWWHQRSMSSLSLLNGLPPSAVLPYTYWSCSWQLASSLRGSGVVSLIPFVPVFITPLLTRVPVLSEPKQVVVHGTDCEVFLISNKFHLNTDWSFGHQMLLSIIGLGKPILCWLNTIDWLISWRSVVTGVCAYTLSYDSGQLSLIAPKYVSCSGDQPYVRLFCITSRKNVSLIPWSRLFRTRTPRYSRFHDKTTNPFRMMFCLSTAACDISITAVLCYLLHGNRTGSRS